jgi:cold shock protein
MDTDVKSSGTVKFYDPAKGFGFIVDDRGGPDLFMHVSEVARAKLVTLDRGERIAYQAVKNDRGFKAMNLERIAA